MRTGLCANSVPIGERSGTGEHASPIHGRSVVCPLNRLIAQPAADIECAGGCACCEQGRLPTEFLNHLKHRGNVFVITASGFT